jgi:hypothetical protein
MLLYNGDFTDLLMINAQPGDLDEKFEISKIVKRFGKETKQANRNDRSFTPARRIRHLVTLTKLHQKIPCVDSIVGPGLSLSSWPPKCSFLHTAARMGCAAIVKHLLEHYACCINATTQGDQGTALHIAAYYGHLDVVQIILDRHADKTITNRLKETPLASARAGQKKYKDSAENFYPIVRRAHRESGTWIPDKKMKFGTTETAETHPNWKPDNWNNIIVLLLKPD